MSNAFEKTLREINAGAQTVTAWFAAFAAAHLVILAVACTRHQAGGWSVVGPGGRGRLVQPENPGAPSSQRTEVTYEYESPGVPVPVPEQVGYSLVTNRPAAAAKVKRVERTETTIGASQKDSAGEMRAKIAGMRPVMVAGLVCLLIAGALAYFSWYTKAIVFAAGGVGIVVLAAVIPGHEWLFIGAGGAGLVVVCYMVVHAYYKGQVDATAAVEPPRP